MQKRLKVSTKLGKISYELFESCYECASTNDKRDITDSRFEDKRRHVDREFCGVSSFQEAQQLLQDGYEPNVEELKRELSQFTGTVVEKSKRKTTYVGYRPNVPAAIQGLPKSMYNTEKRKTRVKVVNVVYDMTCACSTSTQQILKAGAKVISILQKLEAKGFRVNLFAAQSYSDSDGADALLVKIKGANQPFNLKRMSFPLMHPAFFRVIGFDWYSRCPEAEFRYGYGHALKYEHSQKDIEDMYSYLLNEPCFCCNCVDLLRMTPEEYIDGHMQELYR
jgi:hypothetical protein